MQRYVLILLCSTLTISFGVHQYYISATKVVYLINKNSIQCTSRIFLDDLQSLFKQSHSGNSLEVINESEFDFFLKNHLFENFNLYIDQVKQNQLYVGSEFEDDIVVCYFEYRVQKSPKKIEIRNTILMNHIDEQKNIVHLEIGDFKKSYLLTLNKSNFFKK